MSSESVGPAREVHLAALGRVDVLVNNASTPAGWCAAFSGTGRQTLLEDIDTKVVGYLRCAKALAPHMQQRKWGRIVNIGGFRRRSGKHQRVAECGRRAFDQDVGG